MRISQLEIGKEYSYEYKNGARHFSDTFIFKGFTMYSKCDRYLKYGERYNTLKEVKKALCVSTVIGIENHDTHETYMETELGSVFYLFDKKWCRGSGCDTIQHIHPV